jgi:HemY protein
LPEAVPPPVGENAVATAKNVQAKRPSADERKSRKAQKDDATVYVTPRAPDDPGTEPPEPELEQPVARRNFRAIGG